MGLNPPGQPGQDLGITVEQSSLIATSHGHKYSLSAWRGKEPPFIVGNGRARRPYTLPSDP